MGCCKGGLADPGAFYADSRWHDADCAAGKQYLENKAQKLYYNPEPWQKAKVDCECGADKTYGPANIGHSHWCPKYVKA